MGTSSDPVEDLVALEADLDARALATGFDGLPRRTLLAALLGGAHDLQHASFSGVEVRPAAGRALVSRLSYLTDVIRTTNADQLGASALDALSPLEDPALVADLKYLLGYMHFCELLPEVRRRVWDVSGGPDAGFVLSRSAEMARHEARDVVLAELALTFVQRPAVPPAEVFDGIALRLPEADWPTQETILANYFEWYLSQTQDAPLFGDEVFQAGFGVTGGAFQRFRAYWMAWAEYSIQVADALGRRFLTEDRNSAVHQEYLEWVVPCLDAAFIKELGMKMAKISGEEWEAMSTVFVWEVDGSNAGDGFFPPLSRLSDCYLFSPDAIQIMMPARNLVYALNRRDRKTFDSLVSQHLEPSLLRVLCEILGELPSVVVEMNTNWENGEIDLLAFDTDEPFVFYIEAKASLPPQGARMTKATGDRALEGLSQIARWRTYDVTERQRILNRAFGVKLDDVDVAYGIATQSCLGTAEIWAQLNDVVAFNPPIATMAVARILESSGRLRDLPQQLMSTLDAIVDEAAAVWEPGVLDLGLTTISVDLLQVDETALDRHRIAGTTHPGGPGAN